MRDVTHIPDLLLDAIARAIKVHIAGLLSPLDARVKAIEARGEPVPQRMPDYTPAIEAVRRECTADTTRQLDRAMGGVDALRERLAKLEARALEPVPVPKDGRDGTDGRDGEDGRDAFELDVLPAIDFTRDYARGTLAQHQGGLWRAFANTHGAHGWACVVDGIHAMSVTRDSERGFTVHIKRSSDTTDATSFVMPVLIYRGVYQAGRVYEEGDVVTWAGSLWHCNEPTDTKPEGDTTGNGGAWTLAAKRGRDGKDMRLIGGDAA
jgi:hypothetical protein